MKRKLILFNNFCLLWLVSTFSVMEKLPATSYVRVVDIWLITTQLTPFALVILATLSELFTDEDENSTINHHGFAR